MSSDLWAKSFIIKEEVRMMVYQVSKLKIIVTDPYVINNMEITNLLINHIKQKYTSSLYVCKINKVNTQR